MLDSMLRAAGLRSAAVGNIGRPIIEALNDEVPYDAFAVELSSFQLHWTHSLELHSAVVLNIHPDHLEWYGPWLGDQDAAMAGYFADKARIYHHVRHACVYNVAEPGTEKMVEDAEVIEGARAIGFTLGIPSISMLGVVDDLLVDRAFIAQRRDSALPLASIADVQPAAPHNVENALAAAALARSLGVPAAAVAGDCATCAWAATASPRSPSKTASPGWTTPRPPTRTPRTRRCVRSSPSSGSPADRPRAPASTTWSPPTPTGCGLRCCSAWTAR